MEIAAEPTAVRLIEGREMLKWNLLSPMSNAEKLSNLDNGRYEKTAKNGIERERERNGGN